MPSTSSLEKPISPWKLKPWWCQPWSILLVGSTLIAGSWLWLEKLWLTIPVSLLIVLWWTYFLLLWPRLVQEVSYTHSQTGASESQGR